MSIAFQVSRTNLAPGTPLIAISPESQMSDIKLFSISNGKAMELIATASDLEKPLQTSIEANLETLLGVRFLATEYSTGKTHAGRIDTLGLDENNSPVILEYKRSIGENVISQGLFYLDWLLDHRAEFKLLVLDKFDKAAAESIDWSAPRLICIASDFTKYDVHAVQQMQRDIELVRYRKFGSELLLFELVNATSGKSGAAQKHAPAPKSIPVEKKVGTDKTVQEWFADLSPAMMELFGSLEGYVLSLGDDVQRKDLKLYVAFRRIKNFLTVVFQTDLLRLYLRLDPSKVELVQGYSRDVTDIGHWGTGNVELVVRNLADLEKAKPLIQQAHSGG